MTQGTQNRVSLNESGVLLFLAPGEMCMAKDMVFKVGINQRSQ
jgi:hypothetical protein